MPNPLKILLAVLFFAGLSFGQASQFPLSPVQDQYGNRIAGADVYICSPTATGVPCAPLAAIYTDYTKSSPLIQPVVSDGSGNFTFGCDPGVYQVQVIVQSFTSTYLAPCPAISVTGTGGIAGVNTNPGSGLTGGGSSGTLTMSLITTCSANQVLQWSGSAWACGNNGSLSGVTSGGGLLVTGTTVGLITSCATNQVLQWSGSAWVCASTGSGTVTGASANGGLLLTGTTLGLITSCSANQILQWSGTAWVCGTNGTITGATAGGGLVVTGTSLGLIKTCADQQVLQWSAGGSSWGCATISGGGGGGNTTSNLTSGFIPIANGINSIINSNESEVANVFTVATSAGMALTASGGTQFNMTVSAGTTTTVPGGYNAGLFLGSDNVLRCQMITSGNQCIKFASMATTDVIAITQLPAIDLTSNGIGGGVSGALGIGNGGTGQTTQNAAFDALAPTPGENGDLIVSVNCGTKCDYDNFAGITSGYGVLTETGTTGALNWIQPQSTVNSVPYYLSSTASGGVAGAPLFSPLGTATNSQTGTTYTIASTDRNSYTTFNNAGAIAVTLNSPTGGLANNFSTFVCDIGAGTATITASPSIAYTTGSSYVSASTLALTTGQCARLFTNNTTWFASVISGASTAVSTTAGQILVAQASGTPHYIAFPDVHYIPFANCDNGVAGGGLSFATSTWTAACAAGYGALQATPASGVGQGEFLLELPADWDTSQQPYISIYYTSGLNTTGSAIWTVASACTSTNGTQGGNPAFVSESAFASQTMTAAAKVWSRSGQFTQITSGNNCTPGSFLIIRLTLTGTGAQVINALQAVVTIPRLLAVQAN